MSSSFPFKVEYSWSKSDWVAKNPDDQISEELKVMLEPDESTIGALQAFHERFYPDESPENADTLVELALDRVQACVSQNAHQISGDAIRDNDPIHHAASAWVGHVACRR